jgi:hypothetical protein
MENKLLRFHGLTFQFELKTLGIGAGENDFVGIAHVGALADYDIAKSVNLCGVHGSGSF